MATENTESTLTPSDQEIKNLMADKLLADLLSERVSERRWKWGKRIVFSLAGIALFATYMAFYVTNLGFKVMPNADVVGVVHVSGPIGIGERASAEEIVPVLEKAFKARHVKAIALEIDSSGGQPFESERIGSEIDRLRKETGKPIYAFIDNMGASAAYLLALHTDRIVAGRYSLVGSIGAIIAAWDLHKLADKLEVTQRVYASGAHKNMLNPFTAMTPESDAKAQGMVDKMAKIFAEDFKKSRNGKIDANTDYTTGEVWGGEEALAIGLIDEIGTLESVVKRVWGIKIHNFGPNDPAKAFFPSLHSWFGEDLLQKLFAQIERQTPAFAVAVE